MKSSGAVADQGGVIHHQSSTYAWQETAQGTSAHTAEWRLHRVDRTAPGTKRNTNALIVKGHATDGAAQVGINTSPRAYAALEITSTTGALIVPRMTTTQRDAMTPANGMIIYNTTIPAMQGYIAGAWANI